MNVFALLVGTDTGSPVAERLAHSLGALAAEHGYTLPETPLRIVPDQVSLAGWSLTFRGPSDRRTALVLAVTAPSVGSISPIPVQKTVSGPLFAVVVFDAYFLVYAGRGDVLEVTDRDAVERAFETFLAHL